MSGSGGNAVHLYNNMILAFRFLRHLQLTCGSYGYDDDNDFYNDDDDKDYVISAHLRYATVGIEINLVITTLRNCFI